MTTHPFVNKKGELSKCEWHVSYQNVFRRLEYDNDNVVLFHRDKIEQRIENTILNKKENENLGLRETSSLLN